VAWLFLIFTGLVVGGVAGAIASYLDNRRRKAVLLVFLAWVFYTAALGYSGMLASPIGGPPRIALILVPVLLGALFLARSNAGRDLALSFPVSLLIGAQVFRVAVELFIHQFWSVGLVPKMLTYEGANFDILVGLSAPVVAWLVATRRLSTGLALAWNVFGLLLLANIVARAILTSPALQALVTEVPNRALGTFPFTFIPGLLAPLALILHVLAIRALLAGLRANRAPKPV
jgi:hypothetical protein